MGTYLQHDDIEYFVDSNKVEATGEMNLRIGVKYGSGREHSGTILDQTLTKQELRKFLTEIEKVYFYM